MSLFDLFASKKVRRQAREEAAYALRDKGAGAVDHLQRKAARSEDPKRKRVYRIATTVAADLLRKE